MLEDKYNAAAWRSHIKYSLRLQYNADYSLAISVRSLMQSWKSIMKISWSWSSRNEWQNDIHLWPATRMILIYGQLLHTNVCMYLILFPSPYTQEDLLNYKSMDCYCGVSYTVLLLYHPCVITYVSRDWEILLSSWVIYLAVPILLPLNEPEVIKGSLTPGSCRAHGRFVPSYPSWAICFQPPYRVD